MKQSFETLTFEDRKDCVRVHLLRMFYCDIAKNALPIHICEPHTIEVPSVPKFQLLLSQQFNALTNKLTGKPAVYIHRNSGIPLIGQANIGIVDRNSSLIEVKPITGCNISCTFCSVDEGPPSKKICDYVVEKDYLVEEMALLLTGREKTQIYINTHGEPTLYADLVPLVADLRQLPTISDISLNTNGTLLTPKLIDALADAGLTQINLSLNAVTKATADALAGQSYPLKSVMRIASYIAQRMQLVIAPVYVPSVNETELADIITFAQSINARVGIQNFMPYKRGRNPVKSLPMVDFYSTLQKLEKDLHGKLIHSKDDYNISNRKSSPSVMKKGEVIRAPVVTRGRYPGEMVLAYKQRAILLRHCNARIGQMIKCKIVRNKHNIFIAETLC